MLEVVKWVLVVLFGLASLGSVYAIVSPEEWVRSALFRQRVALGNLAIYALVLWYLLQ